MPIGHLCGHFVQTDALLLKPHITVKDAFLPACVRPKIFLYLKAVAMGPQMAWVPYMLGVPAAFLRDHSP